MSSVRQRAGSVIEARSQRLTQLQEDNACHHRARSGNAARTEGLGDDAIPDFLAISLSAGDYIGHRYGPGSIEISDHYRRLDEKLGDFLAFLDERARASGSEIAVILTSDHGVAAMPEYSEGGGRLPTAEAQALVDAAVLPAAYIS